MTNYTGKERGDWQVDAKGLGHLTVYPYRTQGGNVDLFHDMGVSVRENMDWKDGKVVTTREVRIFGGHPGDVVSEAQRYLAVLQVVVEVAKRWGELLAIADDKPFAVESLDGRIVALVDRLTADDRKAYQDEKDAASERRRQAARAESDKRVEEAKAKAQAEESRLLKAGGEANKALLAAGLVYDANSDTYNDARGFHVSLARRPRRVPGKRFLTENQVVMVVRADKAGWRVRSSIMDPVDVKTKLTRFWTRWSGGR